MACSGCGMMFSGKVSVNSCPYILPCRHSGCQHCIRNAIKNHTTINCRSCKNEIKLPPDSNIFYIENSFPINFYIIAQNVYRSYKHQKKQTNLGNHKQQNIQKMTCHVSKFKCAECNTKSAHVYCKQCNEKYCNGCFSQIHSFAALKKHLKIPIEHIDYFYHSCHSHPEDTAIFYCKTCKTSVCANCLVPGQNSCKEHDVIVCKDEGDVSIKFSEEEFAKYVLLINNNLAQLEKNKQIIQSKYDFFGELSKFNEIRKEIKENFMKAHNELEIAEFNVLQQLSMYSLSQSSVTQLSDDTKLTLHSLLKTIENCRKPEYMNVVNFKLLKQNIENAVDNICLLDEEYRPPDPILQINTDLLNNFVNFCQLTIPNSPLFKFLPKSENFTFDEIDEKEESHVPIKTENLQCKKKLKLMKAHSSTFDIPGTSTGIQEKETCRPNQNLLKETSLCEGTTTRVFVTHINNPHDLYVQSSNMRKYLYQESRKMVDVQLTDFNIELGKLYIFHDKSKDNFYRVKVLDDTIEANLIKVNLIDHGSTRNVPIKLLKPIKQKYSTIEPGAMHCRLADCIPVFGNWNKETTSFMQQIIKSAGSCVVYVTRIINFTHEIYLTVYSILKNQPPYYMNESLVFLGHAQIGDPKNEINKVTKIIPNKPTNIKLQVLNDSDEVFIVNVVSPDEFYVRKTSDEKTFNQCSKRLNDCYNLDDNKFVALPQIGQLVACYTETNKWCRGCIETVVDKNNITVYLMDYGNTLVVSYVLIRELINCFYTTPQMAVSCFMYGIAPKGTNWCSEANMLLQKISNNWNPSQVSILENVGKNKKFGIELFGYLNSEFVSINDEMVNKEFAYRTKESHKPIFLPKLHKSEEKTVDAIVESKIPKNEFDDKVPVKILSAVSPSVMYISLDSQEKELNALELKLQEYYENTQSSDMKWKSGDECVAYCGKTKKWHRGKIEKMETKIARVFFKDTGQNESIRFENLRMIEKQFLHIQPGAIKCSLSGILPASGNKWPSLTCEYLKEVVTGCKMFLIEKDDLLLGNKFNITLWAFCIHGGSALEPVLEEWKLVKEMIIDRGLAIRSCVDIVPRAKELCNETVDCTPKTNRKDFSINESPHDTTNTMLNTSNDKKTISNVSKIVDLPSSSFIVDSAEMSKCSNTAISSQVSYLKTWKSSLLPLQDFRGIPTYIDNEFNIYIINVDNSEDTLITLNERIEEAFENTSPQPQDMFWIAGQPCIAQYHLDSKYYRAEIVKVLENQSVVVKFVDYGNEEICHVSSLRKCVIADEIPIQVNKCRIVGVKPIGESWKPETIDLIHQTIVEKECFINLLGTNKEGNILYVKLNIPNTSDLANLLVTMKLADYDNYPDMVEIFLPPIDDDSVNFEDNGADMIILSETKINSSDIEEKIYF